MSAPGEAQARRDARASGAKPRPKGRVHEHVAAADTLTGESHGHHAEAAGRCAIEPAADAQGQPWRDRSKEAE